MLIKKDKVVYTSNQNRIGGEIMNLTKLFDTQKLLDAAIVEKKGLEGRDMLPEKILALQVELGECANEWRGFKFWSEDMKPRTVVYEGLNDGINEPTKNLLLEEYVDCLHFILSIGLDLKTEDAEVYSHKYKSVVEQFSEIFMCVTAIARNFSVQCSEDMSGDYCDLISEFISLGEMIGFTWDQIEQAYYDKNEINHSRQNNGY